MFQCLLFFLLKYDIPTHVGTLEEEVKDEIMETDAPPEGVCWPFNFQKWLTCNFSL